MCEDTKMKELIKSSNRTQRLWYQYLVTSLFGKSAFVIVDNLKMRVGYTLRIGWWKTVCRGSLGLRYSVLGRKGGIAWYRGQIVSKLKPMLLRIHEVSSWGAYGESFISIGNPGLRDFLSQVSFRVVRSIWILARVFNGANWGKITKMLSFESRS